MKFEEIYPKYNNFIEYCLQKVRDLPELEDIKQEILIKIFQKCDSIKNPQAIRAWLTIFIKNYLTDYFRKDKHNYITFSDIEIGSEIYESFNADNILIDHKDPSTIIENEELKNIIQDTLNDLENPWKKVLVARHYNNLAYKEIAEKYDMPLGTVRSRMHRARNRFIKAFSEGLKN